MKVTYEESDWWAFDTALAGVLADGVREFLHHNDPLNDGIGAYPVEYEEYEDWVLALHELALELDEYAENGPPDTEETVFDKLAYFIPRMWT